MDETLKQTLISNSFNQALKIIDQTKDPDTVEFLKLIVDTSIQSAVIVLEEYENLKNA